MCMKNTILKQINDIGAKIGYPFYFYSDGSFGKSIVSGKLNAIVIVKGKFTASALKDECLAVWDDENLSFGDAVICLKEKMNFPIYIYSDGICEKTPRLGRLYSVMVVKNSFVVQEMTKKVCHSVNPKIDHITPKVPRAKWIMPVPVVNDPTPLQLARLEVVRQALSEGIDLTYEELTYEEEVALVYFGTDEEVRAYFPYLKCSELLIWKGNQKLLEDYIEDNSFCREDVLMLMAERCSDEVILKYFDNWLVDVKFVEKLLELERFELIEKIQEVSSLNHPSALGEVACYVETILKAGYPQLLKIQIRKYDDWLYDDVVLLMQSGNLEMIKYYLDYHPLCSAAQKELVKLANSQLIEMYQERYGFDADIAEMAKWRGLLSV